MRFLNILFFGSFGAAILLSASSGGYDLELGAMGLSVSGLHVTADALCVVTALLFGMHFIYFYNFCVLDTVVRRLYPDVASELKPLRYLDKAGDGAFILLIQPRLEGYRSGCFHVLASFILMLSVIAIYLAMLLAVGWSILSYAMPILSDQRLAFSDAVGAFGVFVLVAGYASLVFVAAPFRYTRL